MEITLNASHFITSAIVLIVLAMLCYAFILIKALLLHLKGIQARTKAIQKRLQKSREHLNSAGADIEYIHEALESTETPQGHGREECEADIPSHLSEFKRALATFRRQSLGKSE